MTVSEACEHHIWEKIGARRVLEIEHYAMEVDPDEKEVSSGICSAGCYRKGLSMIITAIIMENLTTCFLTKSSVFGHLVRT